MSPPSEQVALRLRPIIDVQRGSVDGGAIDFVGISSSASDIEIEDYLAGIDSCDEVDRLNQWMIDRAVFEASHWRHDLPVLISMSHMDVYDERLVRMVESALSQHDFPASRLTLEVSHNRLDHENDICFKALRLLQGIGVSISLDDVYNGVGALRNIKQFRYDSLKIGREMIADIDRDAEKWLFVEYVVKLSKSIGAKVIADGVVTENEEASLILLGIDRTLGDPEEILIRP